MNDLQVFENEEFGKVRTLTLENEPWFVAVDICKVLNLQNPTMAVRKLEDDERAKYNLGRQGKGNIVNEYGLYSLIMMSNKKEAKQFKRWITHDVIPAIRKTGGYIAGEENLSDDELVLRAMNVLNNKLEQAKKQLKEQEPKVRFAESIETSRDSILIGDLAKILKQNGVDIGQNRLFEWMRQNGYLISRLGDSFNMPTQAAMNMRLFEIKETVIRIYDEKKLVKTVKVTGKGQTYFINKFLN